MFLGTLQTGIAVNPTGINRQASSSINLTCSVQGMFVAPLSYMWKSTCSENCFVLLATESTITKKSINSIDSGNHTCTVIDAVGNSGTSTIQIAVKGKWLNIMILSLQNSLI